MRSRGLTDPSDEDEDVQRLLNALRLLPEREGADTRAPFVVDPSSKPAAAPILWKREGPHLDAWTERPDTDLQVVVEHFKRMLPTNQPIHSLDSLSVVRYVDDGPASPYIGWSGGQ